MENRATRRSMHRSRHRKRLNLDGDVAGQGLAEYIIIVIVVAIVVILGVRYFGKSVFGSFSNATQEVSGLSTGESKRETKAEGGGDASLPSSGRSGGRSDIDGGQSSSSGDGSSRGGGSGEGGAEAALDRQVSQLKTGVGDRDATGRPVESITIDPSFLWTLGGAVIALGVVTVFLKSRKNQSPKREKKKKRRFSIFSAKRGEGEEGQVLVIGLIVCVGLVMVAVTVANVGMMVAEKIQLQDTVDASAYSAAVAEARYMNVSAYLNRTMVANYDTMAFDTALWSMTDAGDHGMAVLVSLLYQIDAVLILFPFTTGFGTNLDRFIDLLRDDVHKPLHDANHELNLIFAQDDDSKDLNGLIETYNTDVLSMYQGLLYAAQQASRFDVIRNVARRNDPEVVTTTVLGLGAEAVSYDELARAVDWVIREPDDLEQPFKAFQSSFNKMAGTAANEDDNPLLLAAVTEASLNRFSAGRDRDGDVDGLRNFGIGNILPLGALETALDIECNIEEVARAASPAALFTDPLDCNASIQLNLGFNFRDGFEDKADQIHVPFIARRRMREVTLFGLRFNVSGLDGILGGRVEDFLDDFEGDRGHTSGEKHADVGNVANSTINLSGIDFARAAETFKLNNFQTCCLGTPVPTCGLNALNILEASIMLPNVAPPDIPPLFVDDHWDGSFEDLYPVSSYQLIPPLEGNVEVVEYTLKVAAEGTEAGVPKYDWQVDLDNVGFPNYIYPQDGAEQRPNGTSGGNTQNFLTGPSIAVVGTKAREKIGGLPGLGLGNPYSMSAIARAQVYYLRNPNRPDELPSLFNPHWVARLAPIDSGDTPGLLKEGLPYVAGVGVPLTPAH